MIRGIFASVLLLIALTSAAPAQQPPLPAVPPGFRVALFAREPAVRHPASLAFDARGRLFVGQGPQFRHPKPDTPGDSIKILLDTNDDGQVDEVKTFAEGFNCIQSLAFKGRDLWVANAPDLTIVRDLDGDDVADEYVRLYTDLGNLEHGLHGLNWGPDGKLYMSKGNSKGLNQPERYAPQPFRELWGLKSPPDAQDFPPPQTFRRGEYQKNYHNPADDWGREGGVLRCDDAGRNLEIVCRGFRNPWDITFDDEFCWLGTDNDQTTGDKIFMPFPGAHFGWGHPWSFDWSGQDHPPTVPASGPLFEGSGTGIVYLSLPQYPPQYRGVFLINDWLRKTTYAYRPVYRGALRLPDKGKWEEFITAGKALYKPTDIEIGPDGAIWVLGWDGGYGATFDNDGKQDSGGRVFRIWHEDAPPVPQATWLAKKRRQPLDQWSFDELAADVASHIPAWRVAAQDELVRRGDAVKEPLMKLLSREADNQGASPARETWAAWTLGRIGQDDRLIDDFFAARVAAAKGRSFNLRIQSMRILAHRIREAETVRELPDAVANALADKEPRIRFEAVLAMRQARQTQMTDDLIRRAAQEPDRVAFYAVWNALAQLADEDTLSELLHHEHGQARRAAILALADQGVLTADAVLPLRLDEDEQTAALASLWLARNGRALRAPIKIEPAGGEFVDSIKVEIRAGEENVEIRYSNDGSPPAADSPRYDSPLTLSQNAVIRAAMFRDGRRLGPIVGARFRRLTEADLAGRLIAGNLKSARGRIYQTVRDGLKLNVPAYTDRNYVFTSIPEELVGATYIRTANSDADTGGESLFSLHVAEDVTVYVAHDERAAAKPAWMQIGGKDGFQQSDLQLASSDATMRLYKRVFSAGTLTLGGNRDDGRSGGISHYVVIVEPAPIVLRDKAITFDEALPLVGRGDAERGESLFFSRRVNCAGCHRISDRGNDYAPNLSDAGLRIKAEDLVQSILTPSAVITEGFQSQSIITEQGKIHTGIVLEETGKTLKLALPNGRTMMLDKATIEERRTTKQSAMPENFARFLLPQQVADLTAFLLTQKKRPETTQN